MVKKLEVTLNETLESMVSSLLTVAKDKDKDLTGLTYQNFNVFLDDLFADGGEVRCEQFTDLSIEYGLQFGKLESSPFSIATHKCIEKAINKIAKVYKYINENSVDALLDRFTTDYKQEVKRLSKSGGITEEELNSKAFLEAVLLLLAETYVSGKSKAKAIYDNLQHF